MFFCDCSDKPCTHGAAHFVRDHIIISGDMDGVRIVLRIYHNVVKTGRVAQRTRHLTTNQGIAGSNPAVVE